MYAFAYASRHILCGRPGVGPWSATALIMTVIRALLLELYDFGKYAYIALYGAGKGFGKSFGWLDFALISGYTLGVGKVH